MATIVRVERSGPGLHPELARWQCPSCGRLLSRESLVPGAKVEIKCGRCNETWISMVDEVPDHPMVTLNVNRLGQCLYRYAQVRGLAVRNNPRGGFSARAG